MEVPIRGTWRVDGERNIMSTNRKLITVLVDVVVVVTSSVFSSNVKQFSSVRLAWHNQGSECVLILAVVVSSNICELRLGSESMDRYSSVMGNHNFHVSVKTFRISQVIHIRKCQWCPMRFKPLTDM